MGNIACILGFEDDPCECDGPTAATCPGSDAYNLVNDITTGGTTATSTTSTTSKANITLEGYKANTTAKYTQEAQANIPVPATCGSEVTDGLTMDMDAWTINFDNEIETCDGEYKWRSDIPEFSSNGGVYYKNSTRNLSGQRVIGYMLEQRDDGIAGCIPALRQNIGEIAATDICCDSGQLWTGEPLDSTKYTHNGSKFIPRPASTVEKEGGGTCTIEAIKVDEICAKKAKLCKNLEEFVDTPKPLYLNNNMNSLWYMSESDSGIFPATIGSQDISADRMSFFARQRMNEYYIQGILKKR